MWWWVEEHLGRGVTRAWSINKSEERISSWSVVGMRSERKRNIWAADHMVLTGYWEDFGFFMAGNEIPLRDFKQ